MRVGAPRLLLGVLAWASLGGFSVASPLEKRQKSSLKPDDEGILNYALTLEHLEAAFYRQGLANFTTEDFKAAGYAPSVYSQVETISKHETAHVSFLTKTIQCKHTACQYAGY